MKKKLSLLAVSLSLLISCNRGSSAINYVYGGTSVRIDRFDTALINYLTEEPEIRAADTSLFERYPDFATLYVRHIVPIKEKASKQETGQELARFFSDPTLFYLYKDAENAFANTTVIEEGLTAAFSFFAANFPTLKIPRIYFHVSGLNQNVIVGENILSLSIDKYLGEGYPLYKDFFYEYERKTMTSDRAASDLATGFLLSEFPYRGKEETLLNKMLYWGKIKYVLSKAFPDKDKAFIMGYTLEELRWCAQNEAGIWKQMVGKRHLYSGDRALIAKFTEPAPHTTPLGSDAPSLVGVWAGWQIIEKYMQTHPNVSLPELLRNSNYVEILKESGYRP